MEHVCNVIIDNTKVSADLTDFPVYINLADLPASFWDTVANGGGDIRVYKSDGTTELPREVVSCDTSTDTGELHVKYSGTLSSSVDTTIQIHADGTSSDYAVDATYGAENVWKSGYVYVSHDGGVTDSTSNENDFTNSGADAISGKIGGALDLVPANSDYLYRGAMSGISGTVSEINFTIWANPDTGTNSSFRAINGANNYFNIHFPYSNNTCYWDWGTNGAVRITANGSSWYDSWAYYNFVANTSGSKIYRNASQQATDSSTTTVSASNMATWEWGRNSGPAYWDGGIDEVRLFIGVLGESWQTTEYNNQNSASTFYDVEAVVSTGTNCQINIGDEFKTITEIYVNVGDEWKSVTEMSINVGDEWKSVF